MKIDVQLEKVYNNHNRLRDDLIIGFTSELPTVGSHFLMFGEPVSKEASLRMVNTSMVTEVNEISEGLFEFRTQSGSVYRVKILSEIYEN